MRKLAFGHRFCANCIIGLKKLKVSDFLFYCAFACFAFSEVAETTAFAVSYSLVKTCCKALLLGSAAMLFLRLLLMRESGWQWVFTFGTFILAALIFIRCRFEYPFWIFLFVLAGKGVELEKIAKITLVITCFLTFITLVACYMGFIADYVIQAGGERSARSALGFTHPNRLGERIIEICMACWYLYSAKQPRRVFLVCLAAALFIYFLAESRGSCVLLIMLMAATVLYPVLTRVPRLSVLISAFLVVASVSISFYFMVAYTSDDPSMALLNRSSSGRLSLMNSSYEYGGITLLGTDFSDAPVVSSHYLDGSDVHFLVDNSYARLLLLNGVVPTVLFFFLIGAVYVMHYRERIFPLALLGLTIALLLGVIENFALDIQFNYFLLLAAEMVFMGGAKEGVRQDESTRPVGFIRSD